MNVFGQFRPNPFRGRNFLHGRFPKTIDRAELSQEQILPVLTYARTIVENAFADSLLHQELMVGVGESVRFVPNALQQSQRA